MNKPDKNSILVADDDTASLMQITQILGPEYEVYAAKNGASALRVAEKALPDLILLDMIMPDMDGFEVLANLKKSDRTKEIPVIFITGISESSNEGMGLDLGAVDYIRKPINESVVKLRVKHQIQLVNMRRELEDLVESAQSANRAKSSFLANMSHEIRTPLNVIVGLTDLLLDDDVSADNPKDYLKKIRMAGNVLTGIINDVLDISKIESGKLTISPVRYEMASLLNDIITINIMRIEKKPILFKLDISDDMLLNLYGDDLRVKQIFNNLLSNAFKYTQEGTVTLSVRCAREGEADVRTSISVSDTGIGIRKEDIEKLFGAYAQVDTTANRHIEGTGLGLNITKGLVELMGGEISVESEYGKGTTFHVNFLQGYVNDEHISLETIEALRGFRYEDNKLEAAGRIERPDLSWAKVLVVDDFSTNLDVTKGILGKYKMQVDCLTSGQDAIDRIKLGQPVYNAIFMDHMMPGMDGIEAVQRIRALDAEYARAIPIIALTANAVAGNQQLFLENGFQAFLTKPVNMRKLDSVVRQWIMGKAASPAPAQAAPRLLPEGGNIEIPGINTKLGLSIYDGDREMLIEILRSYAENIPAEVNKLRHVSEQTLHLYAIDAHTIKGASSSIGAKALTNRAKAMEGMAKSGDLSGVLAENESFIKDVEILVENIKAWLSKND